MTKKHARWSPSKLAAVEQCPCFESDQDLRRGSELEASEEGTLLHYAAEHENPSLLETEEQMHAYGNALEYVNNVIGTCTGRVVDHRELRVVVRGLTWGISDRVIADYGGRTLHVFDYKFGQVPVDPAELNLQIHAYGTGALERFLSFDRIVLHIVAPRIPMYSSAEFDRGLIKRTKERIHRIITNAASPFKQPRGGEHCAFCTNKPLCPVMTQAAADSSRGVGLLPVPKDYNIETLHDPVEMAKALLIAKVLPDWCTLVKRVCAKNVLEYGEDIPGYGLRRRAGSLTVRDAAVVLERTVEGFGVSHEELLVSGAASISLSRLAELLMAKELVPEFETKRDYMDLMATFFGDAVSRAEDVVYLQKERGPTDGELWTKLNETS